MSLLNRAILRGSTVAFRNAKRVQMAAPRAFSTFNEKERAEETRYIRSLEQKRHEEELKRATAILAQDDNSEEKQNLLKALSEKKEDKGFIARWGLDDWKLSLPLGLFLAIPAISNEIIIIDAEAQLSVCFLLFATTMYKNVGPIIAKGLDEYSAESEKEFNDLNAAILTQVEEAIAANKGSLSLEEDFKTLHSLTDQVAVAQAEVLNQLEEVKYREAIIQKLESLQALEDSAASAMRQRIVTSVKADVLKTFQTNKQVQENALNQAIAVLTAGANSKLGKDVVGEVFVNSIKSYRESYAKQPAGSDEILKKLEKDVAALASAPEVTGKGGNVFPVV